MQHLPQPIVFRALPPISNRRNWRNSALRRKPQLLYDWKFWQGRIQIAPMVNGLPGSSTRARFRQRPKSWSGMGKIAG